jgi:hypothetical protein
MRLGEGRIEIQPFQIERFGMKFELLFAKAEG